jgi:predicted membrane protein
MKGRRHNGSFFALMVITVGIVFLVANLMEIDASSIFRTWWPLLLVFFGGKHIATRCGGIWGWFLLGAGGFLLARNLDVLDANIWGYVWPSLIVLAGLTMLLPRRKRHESCGCATKGGEVPDDGADTLKAVSVFAEQIRRVSSTGFKGGEATAVFGALTVDLSSATVAAEGGRLEVNAVFGSVRLRLPAHVRVALETNSVLGSLVDKRAVQEAPEGAPRLVLEGNAVMGSIEIQD